MKTNWKEDIVAMSADEAIAWLSNLDEERAIKFQKAILFGKTNRPDSKLQQLKLLKFIAQNPIASQEMRAFGTIAAAHKAMEALEDTEVRALLPQIDEVIRLSDGLPNGDMIRENGIHVKFSAYSVAWHMAIFLGAGDVFFQYGDSAVEDFERVDRTELGKPFFQTCTNVVRCTAVSVIHGAVLNDVDKVDRALRAMKRAASIGIEEAWDHEVIFKEYTMVPRTLEACLFLKKKVSEDCKAVSIPKLLKTIFDNVLRKHEPKKVVTMKEKFDLICSQ